MIKKQQHSVRLGIRVTQQIKDRLMQVSHAEGHDNISIVARRLFAQLEVKRDMKRKVRAS